MDTNTMRSQFASFLPSQPSYKKITDTCVRVGNNIYILAVSETYECINGNNNYSIDNHDYHQHSEAYNDNLHNIVSRYKQLISPEIEIDRKNGSSIEKLIIFSNFAEVTHDGSVFQEINVLPIICDDKAIFNNIMQDYKRLFNDLEKAGFTGSKRTGMHFHLSQGLCTNMTATAYLLSTLTKEQLLLYFGRKLNYGYDTQSALYSFYCKRFTMAASQLRELEKAGFSKKQLDKIINAFDVACFKQCQTHTDVLHFTSFKTWEFRACKGTTNFTTFSERLKIVLEIFTKQRLPKKVNDFKSVKAMQAALALTEENNR